MIVVLGSGISGMMAGIVLQSAGVDHIIIGQDGGEFQSGGLKFIHASDVLELALEKLGIEYQVDQVHGGLFWRNSIWNYPDCLSLFGPEADTIQSIHYLKSRGTLQGYSRTCMNDPGAGPQMRLVFSLALASKAAFNGPRLWRDSVVGIDTARQCVLLSSGQSVQYSQLMTSLPAKVFAQLSGLKFPDLKHGWVDMYSYSGTDTKGYDYIYTPSLRIGRISPGWVELPRSCDTPHFVATDMVSAELSQVIGKAGQITYTGSVKGHVVESHRPLIYPDNVLPIGRFATWASRETADVVAQKVYDHLLGVK